MVREIIAMLYGIYGLVIVRWVRKGDVVNCVSYKCT